MSPLSEDQLLKRLDGIENKLEKLCNMILGNGREGLMTRMALVERSVGTGRKRAWRLFEIVLAAGLAACSVHFLGG